MPRGTATARPARPWYGPCGRDTGAVKVVVVHRPDHGVAMQEVARAIAEPIGATPGRGRRSPVAGPRLVRPVRLRVRHFRGRHHPERVAPAGRVSPSQPRPGRDTPPRPGGGVRGGELPHRRRDRFPGQCPLPAVHPREPGAPERRGPCEGQSLCERPRSRTGPPVEGRLARSVAGHGPTGKLSLPISNRAVTGPGAPPGGPGEFFWEGSAEECRKRLQ